MPASIWRPLRDQRTLMAIGFVLSVLLGIVASLVGMAVGPALQALIDPENKLILWRSLIGPLWGQLAEQQFGTQGLSSRELLSAIPGVLAVLAFMKAGLTCSQWYLWEYVSEHAAYAWRDQLVKQFVYCSPEARAKPEIQSVETQLGGLLSQDIRTLREYVVHFYGGFPREGLQTFFTSVALFTLSPKLFMIFTLCVAPLVILLARVGRRIRKKATKSLEDLSVMTEWIQQRLLGLETIKHLRMESSELQEMKQRSQALESRLLSAARTKARTSPIVEIFGILALVVVLIIALRDVAGDHIGGAALLSFFTSLALLSQSASKLSKYLNSNREGSAAASRLSQALNVLQENERQALMIGNIESGPTNKITCQQVSAQYPDTNSYALKNFSYVFEGGKLYCITGTSGAGKSTLFNVLLGIMRPSGGSVSYSVSSSHELPILFMPQDYQVIAGPLVQNVSYPNEQFDVEKIYQAFEKVELPLKEISSLDVGPSGNLQLSGGQAQRVALARLAYHKAPFVLVDEGTSALDPEIEREILTFLQGLAREGACVIMIAHRSAAAAASNVVLQLEHGELKTSISQ